MLPEKFIKIIEDIVIRLISNLLGKIFLLGTIPNTYTTGRPTVKFDGETTAGARTYPYLSSYSPAAGHRVLVAKINNSYVILGRII